MSEGVVANKHDTRYTVGYEVEPGKIVPLYVKTPKDCLSSGVCQYNESSPWKMGFNVSEDGAWVDRYRSIYPKIEELLRQKLTGEPLSNGKYVNAWGKPEDIVACHATGVLKVGSVYRQGGNYHLQVFLKECKYKERDMSFVSQLSDDDSGYDTVH